jgi:hypothetical protein
MLNQKNPKTVRASTGDFYLLEGDIKEPDGQGAQIPQNLQIKILKSREQEPP